MRRLSARKSRRRNESGGPVSLFPFLAVLICTMGSLILLLVVIARQARLQAAEQREPDDRETLEEVDRALAMAELVSSQMGESREATEIELREARLELGQIEEHSTELRRQIESLRAAWKQLDEVESGRQSDRRESESALAALTVEIEQLENEVEKARAEAAGRQAAYCVVPYEGPHGTRRRPIYMECRADGLVLQPEGIHFGEVDFEGPLDAGNPLDVALRSVREYLTTQRGMLGENEGSEPYPLLLVRPSGIPYFYAGRAAMKSWGGEFGYELIAEDWQLEFPPRDPVLAQTIEEAVEPARRRQRMVIAAAPSRYGGERPVYTVRPYRGGVVARSGNSAALSSSGAGRPAGGRFGPNPSGDGGATSRPATATGRPGAQQPGDARDGLRGTAVRSGTGAGQNVGFGTGNASTAPGESAGGGTSETAPQSLAKTRGRDWGLPDASRNSIAITRPIQVRCYRDRITIVPEQGLGQPKTVSLENGTEASIDSVVSAVWDYMELWGKAGRGMHWRPILRVHLGAGAEPRLAELEALLEGSGLLVENAAFERGGSR